MYNYEVDDDYYLIYPHFKNKTFKWFSIDDEESYNNFLNDPNYKKYLEQNNWITYKEIEYRFNSYGFRSEEFQEPGVPSVLFLGCSVSMGVGINIEDSFTYLISKELNLPMYNLSKAAGAHDTMFRVGHWWIPRLKPKYVFLFETTKDRFEIKEKNEHGYWTMAETFSSHGQDEKKMFHKKTDNIFMNKFAQDLNAEKNILAIEYICAKNDIKFIRVKYDTYKNMMVDRARDLAHMGIKSNKLVADDVLETHF
jgi:hypothetical protein